MTKGPTGSSSLLYRAVMVSVVLQGRFAQEARHLGNLNREEEPVLVAGAFLSLEVADPLLRRMNGRSFAVFASIATWR